MSATTAPLVIATASDSRYALPLAVMLQSAVSHLAPETQVDVYAVNDGIDASTRSRVTATLPPRVKVHWITRAPDEFVRLPNWGRMALTTYHKLTLGEWLPQHVEKVLWLDCDVLVLADVAVLFESDLAGQVALAAQDVVVPHVSSRFGIAPYAELGLGAQAPYFNAGVMLIDVAKWREDEVGARAFRYLERYHEKVVFWDQEALNAALARRWAKLNPRWNWNPSTERLHGRGTNVSEPWLIHFSGNLKPWNYLSTSRRHAQYYEALDQTAWKGWRPENTWRGRALAWYEASRVRAALYPLEQFQLRLVRALTRR